MTFSSGTPAAAGLVADPRVVQRLSDHAALLADGTIQVEVSKLGAPADVYDADFAWIEHRGGVVRFFFGQQGEPEHLHTCLQVKLSHEAFFHHFWENSRDFHTRLKARAGKRAGLVDRTRNGQAPQGWAVEKRHAISANFDVLSHAGNEAQIDFFHLPPSGVATWAKHRDGKGFRFTPKVRILLTTDELFRLLEQAERIVPDVEPSVKDKDLL